MSENQKNDVKYEVEAALKLLDSHGNGQWNHKLLINDSVADVRIASVHTRPSDLDVIATMNRNSVIFLIILRLWRVTMVLLRVYILLAAVCVASFVLKK